MEHKMGTGTACRHRVGKLVGDVITQFSGVKREMLDSNRLEKTGVELHSGSILRTKAL